METIFNVGDKVIDEVRVKGHKGVVKFIFTVIDTDYPISVEFTDSLGGTNEVSYTADGRYFLTEEPTLVKVVEEAVTRQETSRFDYVKYDETSIQIQDEFKKIMVQLDKGPLTRLLHSREKALAITKLEECYMWIGKAIREDQIKRNGRAELQEERKNG